MTEVVNKKFSPSTVMGKTTIQASIQDVNLALDSMIHKKKIKKYTAEGNTIEMVYKTNWFGFATTPENVYKSVKLECFEVSPTTTEIVHTIKMRNVNYTKIAGFFAGTMFLIMGLGMIIMALTRSEVSGSESILVAGAIILATAAIMFVLALFGWTAKRQNKMFQKIFMKRLEEMLLIVHNNRVATM